MNTLNLEEKPSFTRMRIFVFFKLGLGFVVSFYLNFASTKLALTCSVKFLTSVAVLYLDKGWCFKLLLKYIR